MEKTLAEKVAKEVLPKRNIEYLNYYLERRTYVGQMLKKVSQLRKDWLKFYLSLGGMLLLVNDNLYQLAPIVIRSACIDLDLTVLPEST